MCLLQLEGTQARFAREFRRESLTGCPSQDTRSSSWKYINEEEQVTRRQKTATLSRDRLRVGISLARPDWPYCNRHSGPTSKSQKVTVLRRDPPFLSNNTGVIQLLREDPVYGMFPIIQFKMQDSNCSLESTVL